MAASVRVRVEFFENEESRSMFDIDTAKGCCVEFQNWGTVKLFPKELDLLNDMVEMLRLRKDVFPPLPNSQKDVAVSEPAKKEDGE